jgi:acetyl-CoA carboxylase biotin carboxylase subunit
MDEGVYPGWTVPMDYDPLLGKLIVWANHRGEAIARMSRALDEYYVSGIQTNVDLFRRILADPTFVRGEFHTRWLDEWLVEKAGQKQDTMVKDADPAARDAALAGALAWHLTRAGESADTGARQIGDGRTESRWKVDGRRESVERFPER